MNRVRLVSLLIICAAASAQTPEYEIVTSQRLRNETFTPWSTAPFTGDSLQQVAFGVRYVGSAALPPAARVALFARIEAPEYNGTQALVNAYWPNGGIDLSPLAGAVPAYNGAFLVPASASQPGEVAPDSLAAYLAACATTAVLGAVPAGASTQGVTLSTTVPIAYGGSAGVSWPAVNNGWTVPSFNSLAWTPSYDSRYATDKSPGNRMTTFNLGRLIERLVLLQSTSAADALEFLQSTLYGDVFSNQFVLKLQACVILPGTPSGNVGTRTPFLLTTVFESYIHLIPGDVGTPGFPGHWTGCMPPVTLTGSAASRASIVLDGGPEGPVLLAIGNANIPIGVEFDTGNCVLRATGMLAPLDPGNPFCPYWYAFRPLGVSGPVAAITVAERSVLPLPPTVDPPEFPTEPTAVFLLPPKPIDSVPLFEIEPGQTWWNVWPLLPTFL